MTISTNFFDGLNYWNTITDHAYKNGYVIYAGPHNQKRSSGEIISWHNIDTIEL